MRGDCTSAGLTAADFTYAPAVILSHLQLLYLQMNGLTSAGDRASAGLSAGDRASAASAVDPAAMIGQPPGAVSEQDILGARYSF